MSAVNKHAVMQEFVQEFLDSAFLYFENAETMPGLRMIIPTYGDNLLKTDVVGNKYKKYSFAFIGYEQSDVGTSEVNAENHQLIDDFADWVEEQQKNNHFPNFGENTDKYKLSVLQNTADLISIDDSGLAKYMLAVDVDYRELAD